MCLCLRKKHHFHPSSAATLNFVFPGSQLDSAHFSMRVHLVGGEEGLSHWAKNQETQVCKPAGCRLANRS